MLFYKCFLYLFIKYLISHTMSTNVCDFWNIVSVEVRSNNVSVSSNISVKDPFTFFHVWETLIFCQPVDSIASLSENEGVCFLRHSLGIFLFWKEWLTLEELEVLEDLASKSVIDTVIHKVVSAVSKLFGQINLHDNCHSILRDEATWLSNDLNLAVISWEVLLEHLVDLGGNIAEVFLGVCVTHRETTSNIE
jgi:hypothetical protein